jgi:hypothetical protein
VVIKAILNTGSELNLLAESIRVNEKSNKLGAYMYMNCKMKKENHEMCFTHVI